METKGLEYDCPANPKAYKTKTQQKYSPRPIFQLSGVYYKVTTMPGSLPAVDLPGIGRDQGVVHGASSALLARGVFLTCIRGRKTT